MEWQEIKHLSKKELDEKIKEIIADRGDQAIMDFAPLYFEIASICDDLNACQFVEEKVLRLEESVRVGEKLAENLKDDGFLAEHDFENSELGNKFFPQNEPFKHYVKWGVFNGLHFTARKRSEAILWVLTNPDETCDSTESEMENFQLETQKRMIAGRSLELAAEKQREFILKEGVQTALTSLRILEDILDD
jgi:hypothetical protein